MGKTYKDGHEFPADFGFTGSAGKVHVKPHLRGPRLAKGGLPPLGGGQRFSALESKLAAEPGVTNPGALAASIGRKKYGAAKMASLAAKGRGK